MKNEQKRVLRYNESRKISTKMQTNKNMCNGGDDVLYGIVRISVAYWIPTLLLKLLRVQVEMQNVLPLQRKGLL